MEHLLVPPAGASFLGIPAIIFSLLIPVAGVCTFVYILTRRIAPLVMAAPDPRLDNVVGRAINTVKFAVGQYRQPRYMMAGVLHIVIFAGFCVLSLRSITLVMVGVSSDFALPGMDGFLGEVYGVFKDFVATFVLAACVTAAVRRGIFKPERYAVPPALGKEHTGEAVLILGLISGLMLADMCFEGSLAAAYLQKGMEPEALVVPGTGTWFAVQFMDQMPLAKLQRIHLGAYFAHEIIFFTFLCLLPLGKHFHVITSIPNVFLSKLKKGSVKPVKWGVPEEKVLDLESLGVKKITDFTWKHILDFYTCADCGRCSDQCPANAVGRPLSPRFISVKSREHLYKSFPIWGEPKAKVDEPLIGGIFSEDEIWSCTTCGACEAECPIFIEYIDKMVDLRRGMVDDGNVPQSLQKPLGSLEKRGNPYGIMERKRADWVKEIAEQCPVRVLDPKKGDTAPTLYFVDSITSFDEQIQSIGQSAARVLTAAGIEFGILGPAESDSGHEVRRFGEESLFMELKDRNTEAILESGAQRIVTTDPHAFNALSKDYQGLPKVEHISQVILRAIQEGKLRLKPTEDSAAVYTYHDPCYLGRHNGLYAEPRSVLDAIPGLRRVEMKKSFDRSFCCGGGGLMLFYEPVEETRMGKLRVGMARSAGANVIVTACPFCKVNIEDGIKTSGLEGKMQVIDLVELVDRHLVR